VDTNAGLTFPTNQEIARILFQVATLLSMTQDNFYRVRAYRRAAFGVLNLPKPYADYVVAGERAPLPGVGDRIRGRLYELVNTGHMGVYEALLVELGEPLASLLAVHGIGPKTATRLVQELSIGSLTELVEAAQAGRIRALRGFGPRREEGLARAAEILLEGAA
jgi:DNA polymerase (family 10)